MKLRNLLFTLLLSMAFSLSLDAQDPYHLVVQKGSSETFQLTIAGISLQIVQYPSEPNVLELLSVDGKTYMYRYTPDPEFEGADDFRLEEFVNLFPLDVDGYDFTVDVVSSEVTTSNDFVRLTSDEEIIIDALANDASTASELSLDIAQVMFGTAVVNEDQTISYTPGDSDQDFIVYVATDVYGTSSRSTIYITSDAGLMEDDTEQQLMLPAGQFGYIFLPDHTFTIAGDDASLGTLEAVADDVFAYHSSADTTGVDSLTFENQSGATHVVSVEVVSQYEDVGFVKDDVVYCAMNTVAIFNVKDNDESSQTVISDYSEELLHLGNGQFVYTPEAETTGVVELFYEADNGMDEPEIGNIQVIVGNHEPVSNINYALSTPINKPRIIEYSVPLGSEFFGIEDYPEYGVLEVFDDNTSVDVACTEDVQKLFALYTPNADFVGEDHFILKYCASDNNFCKNVAIDLTVVDTEVDECICVEDCVWPGDANADGIVNMRDMLAIGGHLGSTGPVRALSPYAGIYDGVESASWSGQLANGTGLGHLDANGDGVVTMADMDFVADNYGSMHTVVRTDLFGVKDIPFGFINDTDVEVGELKTIDVYAGSEAFPAVDMRGIAFSVSLPAASVDDSTLAFTFERDNYFVKNAPFVSMVHMSGNGLVHAGGIKTDNLSSTGAGIIGQLSFIVVEDAEGIRPHMRRANGSEILTIELFDITYEDGDGVQHALPNTSIDLVVKYPNSKEASSLKISPNPSSEIATISSLDADIEGLDIVAMDGTVALSKSYSPQSKVVVNTSDLPVGVYVVRAKTNMGVQTTKLIKGI